jgi:hypothetical protein
LCVPPVEPKVVGKPPGIISVPKDSTKIKSPVISPGRINHEKPLEDKYSAPSPGENNPFKEHTGIPININIIHPPGASVDRIVFDPIVVAHAVGNASTDVTILKGKQYKATFYFSNATTRTFYFNDEKSQIVLQ